MSTNLLITGATGQQGGAVIQAISSLPQSSKFTLYAVTRNPSSPSSIQLSNSFPHIKLVKGDLNDCSKIFETVKVPIWGVFSVQTPIGPGQSMQLEEKHGKDLVDVALASGVSHFVYTSVERGGFESTNVPHFQTKHRIETYLIDRARDSNMTWTILRPTSFMDNLLYVLVPGLANLAGKTTTHARVYTRTNNFFARLRGAIWRYYLGRDGKRQFIACADIGMFAALAFTRSEMDFYRNRAHGLAGDSFSFDEADRLARGMGFSSIPDTYRLLGLVILKFVAGGTIDAIYRYFKEVGFHVNIETLRNEHPGLLTLKDWLEEQKQLEGVH